MDVSILGYSIGLAVAGIVLYLIIIGEKERKENEAKRLKEPGIIIQNGKMEEEKSRQQPL